MAKHSADRVRKPPLLDASVVIATRNRVQSLKRALQALSEQQSQSNWELLIINNGSVDGTNELLRAMERQLPLVCLEEPVPGKSRALNRALDVARGALIVFTDDDIVMSPWWISELLRASRVYPDARIFCGPVVPVFPADTPVLLRNHAFSAIGFAKFIPPFPEGPLPEQWIPFGCNFAVRTAAAKGLRFREDLGPSEAGTLMGEDTEFIRNLYHKPEHLVFVPTASVEHYVRAELASTSGLQERAFNSGRSIMVMQAEPVIIKYKKPEAGDQPDVCAFELTILWNFYLGQLYQAATNNKWQDCAPLVSEIEQLGWLESMDGISPVAAEWLRSRPPFFGLWKTNAGHTALPTQRIIRRRRR